MDSIQMRSKRNTGALGERLAQQFLRQRGYSIIDANWSTRFGEIDIVAKRDDLLVFVEVKTRSSRNTESAFEGITPAKHERIIKAVYQYLHAHGLDDETDWRIDAIGVALRTDRPPIIDHIEDALDW